MSQKTSEKRSKRLRRVLRRCLLALAALLVLCALLLLSLPAILSSGWLRSTLEDRLAAATGKPARIESLSFGWSEGLRLRGLQIGAGDLDDPAFLASLRELHADFRLLAALRRDLRLTLNLSGLRLRVPPPQPDKPAPEAPAKPLPETLRALFDGLDAALSPGSPGADAHLRVHLADMALRLEPAPGGTAAELRDIFLDLETDGLASGLLLNAGLGIHAGGKRLGEARLEAAVMELLDATGRLAPAQAQIQAKASAPGLGFSATGSLARSLRLTLHAEPGRALAELRPLLPRDLPELAGTLDLSLALSQPGARRLAAELELRGADLRAFGGSLEAKSAGPFDITLEQRSELDLDGRTARKSGALAVTPGAQLRWESELDQVAEGRPRLRLRLAPMHADFAALLPVLRSFLPPGLALGSGGLDLASLEAVALLPQKPGGKPAMEASLTDLRLTARGLERRDPAGSLRVASAALALPGLKASLPAEGAGVLETELSAQVEGIRLEGGQPVSVRELSLPRLTLRVAALRQDPAALFGVTGTLQLEQQAQARGIEARGKAQLPELRQQARLSAILPASTTASAALEELSLDLPLLRLLLPGGKPLETPLTLRASAPDIRLSGPAPLVAAVHGAQLALDLGQALRVQGTASLEGPGGREVQSQGRLSLDAGRLMALAAPLVPPQARGEGALSVDWTLSASLPPPGPKAGQPAARPLSQALRELAFLRQAEIALRLEGLGLDWPLAAQPGTKAETLRLRGLSTPLPLRLATRDGLRESSLSGSLAFGPLDALPGLGPLASPLRGLLSLNGAQQDARSAQFTEILRLQGLDVEQQLSLSVDRLDRVLDRDADRAAAALEFLDASLAFRLALGLRDLPAQATGFGGKGRLEAAADLRLAGSRSLSVSARLLSPGLDLRLGQQLAVEGLTSDIRLDRRFSLGPGLRCPGAEETAPAPLSEQVFDQFPAATQRPFQAEALGQLLRQDHAGRSGGGTLGLRRLRLSAGALPLDLHDLRLVLSLDGTAPGLRAFRAGLLGGDVLGSALVRGGGGRYALEADMAFTGVDPGRLFPARAPRDLGDTAETSARVSVSAPLTPDPEALLQRLDFRADVTRVGPRTLERMLYALDPEEKNETIVQQRRLMGIGYPRWLRVGASYGSLNLSGAVDVKGFQIDLPQVDRLSIANLPLRRQLSAPLASVPQLVRALDALSRSLICRDAPGPSGPSALRFVEPARPQGVTP